MSYFNDATAGYDLTPYQTRMLSRFFRDAGSARIVRSEEGYLISVGGLGYPPEQSIFAAIDTVQRLLLSCEVSELLPNKVTIKYESEISWNIDMDSVVRDVRKVLSEAQKVSYKV